MIGKRLLASQIERMIGKNLNLEKTTQNVRHFERHAMADFSIKYK